MAGLLDALGTDQGMLGLGLLAAGRARPGGGNFGSGLLEALQMVQANKAQREDRALRQQMQQAQMAEVQAQAQARRQQAEASKRAAERQALFMAQLGSAGQTNAQQALSGGGGPTNENAQAIGQPQAIDWSALARQFPDQLDIIKKLAESGDFGRAEVARTIEGRDDQGRPVTQQFDRFGRPVGQGMQQWKAPTQVDLGGAIEFLDPVTLTKLQSLGKTNTPDAILSASTARRGQDMTDARSREKNSIDRESAGKVEWKQDVNGAWIGLPKEVSGTGPVTPVTTASAGKREQQARNALAIIDEAEKLIDKGTGSYVGAGVDLAGRALGVATPGAVAGGQLKALEGALMMAQPRMEGPQSNMDVKLYRQMAAQIGDPTVPSKVKRAALQTVRALHQKYTGESAAAPSGGPSIDDLVKKYGG